MKVKICRLLLISLVMVSFAGLPAFSQAHEGMGHGGERMDKAMERQHRLMAMYAETRAKMGEALEKGDAARVEAGARKILASIPELKRVRPHEHRADRKTLMKIAAAFEKEMKGVSLKVKRGDIAGARESFLRAEKRCDDCHARFRD